MRIGIDARFLTHPQVGGFKTYTEHLIAALSQVDADNQYILYVDRSVSQDTFKLPSNFQVKVVSSSRSLVDMPVREQILLPRLIARDGIEVMHFPCLTASLRCCCPYVVTMHDTIWLSVQFGTVSRSPKRWAMWLYNRLVPLWAARRARAIIAVSEATKSDITRCLGVAADKIRVIYEATKPIFGWHKNAAGVMAIRRNYGLSERFILSIGSADPRKNVRGLVLAYSKLSEVIRSDYELVIVWTHNLLRKEFDQFVSQLGVLDRVKCLESVSDEELMWLYNAASLFVFPSLYEGFGLPPLEAMACGTPVVAADNSSIPEVVGDAAVLVDGRDSESIARGMAQVLSDDTLRRSLIAKGLERASMFSWEKCARETISVYEHVLRGREGPSHSQRQVTEETSR